MHFITCKLHFRKKTYVEKEVTVRYKFPHLGSCVVVVVLAQISGDKAHGFRTGRDGSKERADGVVNLILICRSNLSCYILKSLW